MSQPAGYFRIGLYYDNGTYENKETWGTGVKKVLEMCKSVYPNAIKISIYNGWSNTLWWWTKTDNRFTRKCK